MAEVEIAQFDRFQSYRDDAAADAIGAATDIVADFRTADLQRSIRTTAEEAAEIANQTRFAAEGLQADGTSADPLYDAALGTEAFLAAQGDKVGANARKTFERYKRAVEQGASNKSAARVAVQKEMRDLIAANPVYADVIRQAAAETMGEEEFLVLTRDLAKPERGQSLPETEYEKALRQATQVAQDRAMREGWDEAKTQQAIANAQARVIQIYELQSKSQLLESSAVNKGLQSEEAAQGVMRVAQMDVDAKLEAALSTMRQGKGGLEFDIATINNLTLSFEQSMQTLGSEMRRELAGSGKSVADINALVEQAQLPYKEALQFLSDKDVGTRMAQLKQALDDNASITGYELLPLLSMAREIFPDNPAYALKALETDDAIHNEILTNSARFIDLRQDGVQLTPQQQRALVLGELRRGVTSVLNTPRGQPLPEEAKVGTRAFLGIAYNTPKEERENNKQYKAVVPRLAEMGDPLVGAELARTDDPDSVQIEAAQLWKRNFDSAIDSAAKIGARWTKGREDTTDYRVEIQESAGSPVIVIRRFQLGGEVTASGMTDTWRELPPVVHDAGSESYRGLFKQYRIDDQGTARSAISNPAIYQALYGESTVDVEARLNDAIDRANAYSTNKYQE